MAPPKLTPTALKQMLDEANRQRSLMDEYKGNMGGIYKAGIEKYGLNQKALKEVSRLTRQEPAKAMDFLRELLRLSHMMKLFDQFDAFDDIAPILREILEHVEKNNNGKHGGKKDNTLDELTGEADDVDEDDEAMLDDAFAELEAAQDDIDQDPDFDEIEPD